MNSMTPSQWLDIAVLAVAFIAAISGWRSGALGSVLSFAGVLLGAIAGVLLAPHIVSHIAAPRAKLFTALFLILALVVVGEVAGVVLGRAVRSAIRNPAVRVTDSVIGVVVQVLVVLTAAWLLATPLTQSKDQPELAAAVRGSRVLAQVNEVAPGWLQNVPKRLSALLNTARSAGAVQPHPGHTGRLAGPGAGHQPGGGGHRAQRRQGPQPGAQLSESVGGQRICGGIARPGDDQRARGGRIQQRPGVRQRQAL
jgi:uncharacterized membrane protein required for colicin V production